MQPFTTEDTDKLTQPTERTQSIICEKQMSLYFLRVLCDGKGRA